MPVLEAMACGVPAVAVGFGGHVDFCSPGCSYLVGYTLHPPGAGAVAEGLDSIVRWAEPDLTHLRYQMRYAYEHPAETRERGRLSAETARRGFTWEHSARQALAHLGAAP
jgi:hypothetical protein